MPRFNPFESVSCRYGAPMGRTSGSLDDLESAPGKLYARHCGGDGCYDSGGAYWGHSDVWAVWTRGGELCAYVSASDILRESSFPRIALALRAAMLRNARR